MKRDYVFGVVLALALAVTVGAQTPTSQTSGTAVTAGETSKTQSPQTASPATQPTQPMTLTGCLTPGRAGATAEGGTVEGGANTAARSGDYVLQDATGGSSNGPKSYVLFGAKAGDLIRLAHSRVEIVGSMDPQPAAAFSSGSEIGRSPLGVGNTGGVGTSGSGATPVTGAIRTAGTGTATPATPGTVTMDAGAVSPRFKVTSVRPIPGDCGGK